MALSGEKSANGGRGAPSNAEDQIEFVHRRGAYTGMGKRDRAWSITPTFTGWRLEFRDPGDATPTYAGTHASLEAAQREASS